MTTAATPAGTGGSAPSGLRHAPRRTCIGCRAVRQKRDMIRLVLPREGPVVVDPTGRRNGRGAYICRQTGTTCLVQARRRRALVRAFRTTADRVDVEALAAGLAEHTKEDLPSQP